MVAAIPSSMGSRARSWTRGPSWSASRSWVQAVGRDAAALELLGQVEGEHDQGELALAVGLNTAVAALEHHVRKSIGAWPAELR